MRFPAFSSVQVRPINDFIIGGTGGVVKEKGLLQEQQPFFRSRVTGRESRACWCRPTILFSRFQSDFILSSSGKETKGLAVQAHDP